MAYILVVDDEEQVRAMLRQMLEREGYKTLGASNGKEALQVIAQHLPDLLVIDLIMPEKDGIELIGEIRKVHPQVKIVAISGGARYIEPLTQLKVAKYLGADLCFSKPFGRQEFVMGIHDILEPTDG